MEALDLLNQILESIREIRTLADKAYRVYNHDEDLRGGIALSALKLNIAAIEQETIAAIYTIRKD